MKRSRRDTVLAGVFVVLAGALLAGGLLWIAGARMLRPVDGYTVLFDDSVSGLSPGAAVESQGVLVGKVRDIALTRDVPPKVAVRIDLDPGTAVQNDTTAGLVGSLVTGIRFVELRGGTAAAGRRQPGATIPGDVASLEHFRGRVTEIADRAIGILRRLDQDVFTAENNTQLNAFVANLGSVADDLRTVTARVRRQELSTDVARLVQQVSRVAETADRLLSDLHDRQDEMLGGVAETLRHINEVATETRELVRGAQAELSSTGGSVGTLVSELSAATNRLEETLDVIRSDPSLLLRGRDLPAREFAR